MHAQLDQVLLSMPSCLPHKAPIVCAPGDIGIIAHQFDHRNDTTNSTKLNWRTNDLNFSGFSVRPICGIFKKHTTIYDACAKGPLGLSCQTLLTDAIHEGLAGAALRAQTSLACCS